MMCSLFTDKKIQHSCHVNLFMYCLPCTISSIIFSTYIVIVCLSLPHRQGFPWVLCNKGCLRLSCPFPISLLCLSLKYCEPRFRFPAVCRSADDERHTREKRESKGETEAKEERTATTSDSIYKS